jgi:hypothetical protein
VKLPRLVASQINGLAKEGAKQHAFEQLAHYAWKE